MPAGILRAAALPPSVRWLSLDPKQAGEPLNYFVYPYVEVDGKPYTAVDKQFAFADKPGGETQASR